VKVEKADLPWRMIVMRKQDSGRAVLNGTSAVAVRPSALEITQRAQPLLAQFEFASLTLHGRDHPVAVLYAACAAPPGPEVIAALDQVFELDEATRALVYDDCECRVSKRILFEGNCIAGVRLAGDVIARHWLRELIEGATDCEPLRPLLLAPLATAPAGVAAQGRVVCDCVNVSENAIKGLLDGGADFDGLRERLRCGTECGSCVPELKRMCAAARFSNRGSGDGEKRIAPPPLVLPEHRVANPGS
jgi:assimilatory nitrate reductase catalytic subunit